MERNLQKKCYQVVAILLIVFALIVSYQTGRGNYLAHADTVQDIYYGDNTYSANGSTSWTESETINYATKTTSYYRINRTYPEYFNSNLDLENTCANVAGSNIIGFYDRYYDELIPNCTVGYMGNRYYIYTGVATNPTQIQGVINDLYIRMSTNNPIAGTNQTQYKTGLSSYVASKGRNTTYNSVMTNGNFDLDKAIAQLNNGYPITLYLSGYNFTDIIDMGDHVLLSKTIYTGNHIAVAYGYQKISYYNADGSLIKTNIYLYVATGFSDDQLMYIVNNNGTLNDAEAVKIS